MITNSPQANNFIKMVDREASRFSVQLLFGSGKTIISSDDKTRTSGYFDAPDDDSPGVIAVAIGGAKTKW